MSLRRGRMHWSLSLAVVAAAFFAPPALATPPVIGEPRTGAELPLGWSGLVEVAWYEEGEMKLEVTGPGYNFVLTPISVSAESRYVFQQYTIDPLPAVGRSRSRRVVPTGPRRARPGSRSRHRTTPRSSARRTTGPSRPAGAGPCASAGTRSPTRRRTTS